MQGVLQGSSLARGGGLLQLAHAAAPQRFVPKYLFSKSGVTFIHHLDITECFVHVILFILVLGTFFLIGTLKQFDPDSLDPLAHPRVYQQKYVLNDRGKMTILK